MISMLSSIRPNPRYVPGGTENFWISAQSGAENNVKVETKMAEEKGKESDMATRKSSLSNTNRQKDFGIMFQNGGIIKNVIEMKFYN